jgi:fumarate reductase subunit C
MSISWWVHKKPFVKFIVRELTSLFVAAYAILLIFQVRALSQGEEAWEALLGYFHTPLSIGLHIIIFIFVVFHSITWFNLAPTAMVLRIGKKRIPGAVIVTINFLMWIILSLAIAWLILSV